MAGSATENFFKIRAEKQDHILNAAFAVFGKQGYRKASMADIAKEAGTTKGMITYYFGSKRTLYLHLVETIQSSFMAAAKERLIVDTTDLFEKLAIAIELQATAIKAYPALMKFVNSVYRENDPEVAEHIETFFVDEMAAFNNMLAENIDFSKFVQGFDPELLCKFFAWALTGFYEEMHESGNPDNIDAGVAEFYKCLDIMRKTFYK